MKTKAIKILDELYLVHNKLRYPNIPENARIPPNYSDKTANGLTKCIIDFIVFNGGQAERINNMGRPIDRRETVKNVLGQSVTIGSIDWVKGSGKNGTADISATINGRAVKIEVKKGKDKQSVFQIKYQQDIERAGGIYYVANDFESFLRWFNIKFNNDGK